MRCWLAILLLLLVPFQFAWAGVETYCRHSGSAAMSHCGHHAHDCRADRSDTDAGSAPHAGCGFCQIMAGSVLPDPGALPLLDSSHVLAAPPQPMPVAAPAAEPERPKWRHAA